MLDFAHEKYKGKPHVHKGRSLEGFDCLGLLYLILKEAGKLAVWDKAFGDLGEKEDYAPDWRQAPDWRLEHLVNELGERVYQQPYEKGDVICFARGPDLPTSLVGLYLPGGYVLTTGRAGCQAILLKTLKEKIRGVVRIG